MKIGCAVHYTLSWEKLAAITIPILEKYCDKHKYLAAIDEVMNYSRYTGIDKIITALDSLEQNDVVMVLDADVLITNFTINIEDFIEDNYDLYISKDIHGINAGVFIIKSGEWSLKFLQYLLDSIGGDIHCEQDAINKYINGKGMDKIKLLPQNSINSMLYENYAEGEQTHENGQWQVGDFILHLPAMSIQKRIEIFQNHLKDIIYE